MRAKGPSAERQIAIARELGLDITPQPTRNRYQEIVQPKEVVHVPRRGISPWPDSQRAAHERRKRIDARPDPKGIPAEMCPNCKGEGCGKRSVRIDEDHYCVSGLKLTREDTWKMKDIHTISEDKAHTETVMIPALLMLKRAFNVDLGNAEVLYEHPRALPGDPGRAHEGTTG